MDYPLKMVLEILNRGQ